VSYDPGADFETIGQTVMSNTLGSLSVRFNTGDRVGSCEVDHARVFDVTDGNRVINSGFENSDTQLLYWRFFATVDSNGAATISNDSLSGDNAILLERLTTLGDTGLDLWGDLAVPVINSETLFVSAWAKQLSAGDIRLRMELQEFDANRVFLRGFSLDSDVGDTEYEQMLLGPRSLAPDVAFVSVSFRVLNAGGGAAVGSFLIDDVFIGPILPARVGNILTEGDFENNIDNFGRFADGSTDLQDMITIERWRFYAVGGASGGVYPRSSAATSGNLGIELQRYNVPTGPGDSALDKNPFKEVIPAEKRIYQFLLDARDGGIHGGTPTFGMQLIFEAPCALVRGFSFDPGASYETWGLTARSNTSGQLDTKMFLEGNNDYSVEFDNARAFDVTYGENRMINGGFENSSATYANWRFFAVDGATGSATLSSDANSGANAVLLERTNTAGDLGLDLNGSLSVAVLVNDTVSVSCSAKTVSRVDGELRLELVGFDSNGAFVESLASVDVIPGTVAYELVDLGEIAIADPSIASVSTAFRIKEEGDVDSNGIGAFLVDDVSIIGTGSSPGETNLLPNGDFEADPAGTAVVGEDFGNDTSTFTEWRVFAINGASVAVTSTAQAASSGSLGVEFVRNVGQCTSPDVDGSGSIDLGDYVVFETCLGGPGTIAADPDCPCFDSDDDGDVDAVDFAAFQVVFEG
jgi:hypothetical protein